MEFIPDSLLKTFLKKEFSDYFRHHVDVIERPRVFKTSVPKIIGTGKGIISLIFWPNCVK